MAEIVKQMPRTREVLTMLDNMANISSSVQNVQRCLSFLKCANSLPFVCSVLSFLEGFLPDEKHDAIMSKLEDIHQCVEDVRQDIKELEKTIKWECTTLRYADAVSRIKQGLEFVNKFNASKGDVKRRAKRRLVDFCRHQSMTLAVNVLLDGLTGKEVFSTSILQRYYSHSGGHKTNLAKLAGRLLQLAFAGMTACFMYEMCSAEQQRDAYPIQAAQEIIDGFNKKLSDVQTVFERQVKRCEDNIEDNMQEDLERVIADYHSQSNSSLVDILYKRLKEKYDDVWLCCLVYDDINGFDNHCFSGFRVSKLHYHGKCAIAFFLEKKYRNDGSSKQSRGKRIVDGLLRGRRHARGLHDAIKDGLSSGDKWGLACIKRYVDLRSKTNASDQQVWTLGDHFTVCLLMM